jgi:outer membrane protein
MLLRMGLRLVSTSFALLILGQVLLSQAAHAQTKMAVISLQRAVLESAEIKKADAEMQAKYKPRSQQLEQLQADLTKIQQQLQSTTIKLTAQQEADLQATGARKQREAQRVQEDLQADVDRERNEILSKSSQKMSEVVKKLAEEKGYDMVVDVSNTVFFKPALDITNDAIAAYNQAYPAK